MIVTLTCCPWLDRTLAVPHADRDQVNSCTTSALEPGGDGVNVSRVLLAHDAQTIAVLPMGGVTGRQMSLLLTEATTPFVPVPISGALAVSTIVVEPGGITTTFPEAGPTLSPAGAFALLACADDQVQHASWLAACGPLAPGLPDDFYATVVRRAHTYGAQVAVAASGEALRHALDAGPDLVSVTRADLAQLLGRDLPTLDDARRAGEDLVRRGIPTVLIALGVDSALLVTDHGYFHARAARLRPVCRAGTGPALLAGVLHALDQGAPDIHALRVGVAWSAAAAQQPGTQPPTRAQTAAVTVSVTSSNTTPLRVA